MKPVDLIALSDCKLNKYFSIRGTSFDRNVRYSPRVKSVWKKLYDSGFSVKEISDMSGAYPRTVRVAVDEEYAEKYRLRRIEESRRYRSTHEKKKVVQEDMHRGQYKKMVLGTMLHLADV